MGQSYESGLPHIHKTEGKPMKRRAFLLVGCTIVALICALILPACGSGSSKSSGSGSSSEVSSQKAEDASSSSSAKKETQSSADAQSAIDEKGTYTSKEDVALYLHTYGHLPSNYITKDEAQDAGWKTEGLDLNEACPGKSIGGDRFGNREGRLPKAKGRTWYECDIDYKSGSRGAKRIVYSSDGLIYYTDDHYKTFEQLY